MEEELIGVKKKNKLWILIAVIVGILLLSGGGYYYYTNYCNKDNTKEKDVKPDLKDDFYESINYEKIKNAKIPSDSGSWNKWNEKLCW